MRKDNFKLKYDDQGKVRYIIKAGKNLSLATATREQAEWMMKNKPVTRGTPTDWPDFCVCAGGDYWFEGEWEEEQEPSIFTENERTGNREQGTGMAGETERQSRRNRKRGE